MPKFVVTRAMEPGYFDGVRLYPVGSVVELQPEEYFNKLSVKMDPFIDEDGNVDEDARAALKKVRAHKAEMKSFTRGQRDGWETYATGEVTDGLPQHPFPRPDPIEAKAAAVKALAAERKAAKDKSDAKPSGRAADQA